MNLTELLKQHNITGNARLIEIELRRIAFERRLDQSDDATRPAIQLQLNALPKANGFARMDAEYLLERERKALNALKTAATEGAPRAQEIHATGSLDPRNI